MRVPWRVLAVGGVLVAGAALLVVVDARRAQHALHRAEARLPALQAAARDGDQARTARLLQQLRADARTADRATSGPLWAVGSRVPVVGRSLAGTAAVTRAVRDVADGVLPPVVVAGDRLRPVAEGAGGRLDLGALRDAGPPLDTAVRRLDPVVARLRSLPTALVLPAVVDARQRVSTRLERLQSELRSLGAAARVAPVMLGASGPRHYFVAFQNNSESRGTGGLLGAYALVTADHGRLTVDRLGSDLDLYDLPAPKVDLGADYRALYGKDSQLWQNTNMSAHFPYAARLWLDMWEQRSGQRLDGAVATDPVALSYLLGATGPVRLPDGTRVAQDDVVALTENDAYLRFAGNDLARKDFLVSVARSVLDRLLGPGAPDHGGVLAAVARAAGERRFLVWSAHPAEQALLEGTSAAGEVPDRSGPFALLAVNNSAANKIDYYLSRSLVYELGRCRAGRRDSTVTVVLRNDVPDARLPRYVVGRQDRAVDSRRPGATSLLVYLYAAQGAALRDASLDGERVAVYPGRERGHPVYVLKVELPRAAPRRLVLHLVEPASSRPPVVPVQPLVRDQVTTVRAAACP